MVRRMRLIIFLLFVIFLLIMANLFSIAYQNPAMSVAAPQSKWTVSVCTLRGTIYDCHMQPLVNAESEYTGVCPPDIRLLSTLRTSTTDSVFADIAESMRDGVPIVAPLKSAVNEQDGLLCFSVKKRYGNRLLAPHIIGYCGGDGGVAGVELACDNLLRSYSGGITVTYEMSGGRQYLGGVKPLVSDTTAATVGGVVLTIDREMQSIVEETAADILTKGAVVVMEPETGNIVACASFPSYQPDSVAQSVADDDGALVNRALSLYDCGSVFKIITAAAALEYGVPKDRVYVCDGSIDVGGTVFHCHHRGGHGPLNMTEAFSQSCNTYFIQLAAEIGADALYTVANAFGFDRRITLVDGLSAATPLLPNRSALEQPAALANLSFGQGYLMTTPLHIAQIVATIVNDGNMPAPRLVEAYIDENAAMETMLKSPSYTVISPSNAATLREMLCAVVESGTGKSAMPASCTAAGKTGTAETGQKSGENAVVQSWFAGYYPAEQPQYVMVVLAEDSNTTNEQATKIFCEISNKLYEYTTAGDK